MQAHELLRSSLSSLLLCFVCSQAWSQNVNENQPWKLVTTADGSFPTARHEAAAVVMGEQLLLMGGRGRRPVDRYEFTSNSWQEQGTPAEQFHHFQPLLWQDQVYLLGGFYCCYPEESSFTHIKIYDPAPDIWSEGAAIPLERQRGSSAAVLYGEKMYMLGGNTQGHNGGAVPWFDEYDPVTGQWQRLPDAPTARDHFYAAVIGSKLIAAAGRQSSQPNTFINTVSSVDIYDFDTGLWSSSSDPIPTQRAGAMVATFGNELIVIGGEVFGSTIALDVVEALSVDTGQWRGLQSLVQARHSGGAGVIDGYLHVVGGSVTLGGAGDTSLHEVLFLSPTIPPPLDTDTDGLTDADELQVYGTDPNNPDSDDDALKDGKEITLGTLPNDADSDDDLLHDGTEVSIFGSNPLEKDSDGDGLDDGHEVRLYGSSPTNKDTDSDGLDDLDEVDRGLNPAVSDSDADGLSDYVEIYTSASDPKKADTDGDGLGDGEEVRLRKTNPLLSDTDADGLDDKTELDAGLSPLLSDSDGDGVGDYQALFGQNESGGAPNPLLCLTLGVLLLWRYRNPPVTVLPTRVS